MIDIVIVGAGGFALEAVDLINQINCEIQKYRIVGFLDDYKTGKILPNLSVIGKISEFLEYRDCNFVVAIASPIIRSKFLRLIKSNYISTPNLIHPTAIISNYVKMKDNDGIFVNAHSNISAMCKINEGVIIDSNVYIGHESIIGEFATIYSGALISGNVVINHHAQIGLGAKLIQGISIGYNTFIGAGSTVISNISENVIGVGTPCKAIKENNIHE